MASQPTMLAAGAALVIATTLVVAAVASQNVRLGGSSAARPVPTSPQQIERSLAQVRADEHAGLQPGWATSSVGSTATGGTRSEIAMTLPADRTPATIGTGHPESADHVGLSEIAAGAIGSGIAPNLPVGNWGLSEVRPNGSSSEQYTLKGEVFMPYNTGTTDSTLGAGQIEIQAGQYAPGVPSQPVYKTGMSDSSLSPSSPSYSELVNQRRGEKYRFHKVEAPDAFNRAGASIR
jgi:hypothetical protein